MEIQLMPVFFKVVTVWLSTAILFFFFYKFFWASMKNYLEKRKDKIAEEIEAATMSNKNALAYETQANEAMKQARVDSKSIVDRSKNEAIKLREEIVNTAKDEANSKLEDARLEIEREKTMARKELEGEIVGIALGAAKEIVKDSIDEKKSEEIVDDFIKELNA